MVVLALALVALLLNAERARSVHANFETERARVRDFLAGPKRCAGEAVVVRSPVRRDGSTVFVARLEGVDCEGRSYRAVVPVRLRGGPADLRRGDRLAIVAQLAPVRAFHNADVADPVPQLLRGLALASGNVFSARRISRQSSIASWIDGLRSRSRDRILATFAPRIEPLARALVLGENDLDPEEGEAFRDSGLMHLLAVSGTHLVFAIVTLVTALRALLVRIERFATRYDVTRVVMLAAIPACFFYADFSGGSGSAWRATWMLSAVFAARGAGLRLSGGRALAVSLVVGGLVDPFAGTDLSFLLSAAATWGLIALGQPWSRSITRLRSAPLRYLALSVVATVSSTLPCAPLLALMDDQLTLAGIVANVVAAPLGELLALPACLLHVAASGPLEQGLAYVGSGALGVVRHVALLSAGATFASFSVPLPGPWHGAVGIPLIVFLAQCSARARRWLLLGTVAVFLLVHACRGPFEDGSSPSHASEREVLTATFLDVGQGDSTLVQLPDGSVMLIDGGGFVGGRPDPGERVVLPVLRARGIERIDVLVVSHAHPDHILGLSAVAATVPIGEVWHPGTTIVAGSAYAELLRLAGQGGATVLDATELCDRSRSFGPAHAVVLAPCPLEGAAGLNDNSLVLRLELGERSVLLTGDVEADGERRLLERLTEHQGLSALRADVLKVAHHGSDTSTTEAFLGAVDPAWAVISAGVRNRFDHPRPTTLARLSERGVRTLRTDRHGSATVLTDGETLEVFVARRAR